jgi:RNA polymerase II subunit A small phosphatase-like protein
MNHRKLLVLDLDETLIHASADRLGREGDFLVYEYHVYKRPYLDEFLEFAFNVFDVGVWTSAGEQYARDIVSNVFHAKEPKFLFSSLKCTLRRDFNTGEYVPVKRLSKLKSMGYPLEQIVAVDDTVDKHRDNYGNLVHVSEFKGDQRDQELLLLRDYLTCLADEQNIRSVEKRGWRRQVDRSPIASV